MRKLEPTIPQFDLYEDQTPYEDPGFVHLENIADRSRHNHWLIKPHRHGKMLQILFIYSGKTEVQIDEKKYHFERGQIITIPPGVVHGFRFQPNTDGQVLTIAEPIFSTESFKACKRHFDPLLSKPVITGFEKVNVLFDQICNQLNALSDELDKRDLGQELMLEWMLSILVMTLRRHLEDCNFKTLSGNNQGDLFAKFRQLLEDNFREQWSVKQYADALHTSYSTLNRLCKKTTGLPAKDLIINRMLIAAKRQLIYTQAPLDQIALRLGFKDPAYFSRVFKSKMLLSPSAYRKQQFEQFHTVHIK